MIEWKCFELHTHTLHSDGNFSVSELCTHAENFLYDGIALTDHNTMSGLDELESEPAETVPEGNLDPIGSRRRVPVIPGIEWTTYYGHMLVIGAESYVDWRFARPDTIDEYTRTVKEAGGVTGIAHPFNLGSPMCTGCYWDFKVRNWNNIDFIEVWSEPFPQSRLKNEIAFEWWTELLNQGHHLAASSGWDWHHLEPDKPVLPAATWLGLNDGAINPQAVKEALASGRTIVSCGPFPEFCLRRGEKIFYPGDTLDAGAVNLSITVDENRRKKIWGTFGIRTEKLCLTHNGSPLKTFLRDPSLHWEENLNLPPGWIRIEGFGELEGQKDKLLFFSSPFYISKP